MPHLNFFAEDEPVEREPQELTKCEKCGHAIYEGDDYFNVHGHIICEDCINDFLKTADPDDFDDGSPDWDNIAEEMRMNRK